MAKSEMEIAKLAIAQLTKRERVELFRPYNEGETPTPPDQKLVRRSEAARLLARSCRGVDRLAYEGHLHRVTLPGRRRAAGFKLADVLGLMK